MYFTTPPADVLARFTFAQPTVIIRAACPLEVWLDRARERDDEDDVHVTDVTTPGITSAIRGSLPVDHSFTEPGAASDLAMTVGAWVAGTGTQPTFNLRAVERAADQRARTTLQTYSQARTWGR